MRKNWRVESQALKNEYAIERAFSSYQMGLISREKYCACVSYLMQL